jgi:hypothetical protein
MLGVYAAQCYKGRPFMAPAQAARLSGAFFHRTKGEVERAMYTGYTYFQKSVTMRGIRGTAIFALGLIGRVLG